MNCPKCKSDVIKKNGFTRHGKQNYRCLNCGRQFSLEPEVVIQCIDVVTDKYKEMST